MKLTMTPYVLAALAATVTPIELGSNITDVPLKVTLAADAIDTLKSHGLWSPDPYDFGRGQPNVNNVNATAENLKFEHSGLLIEDLVSVSIVDDDQANSTVDADKAVANTDVCAPYPDCCHQCHTCEEACVAVILCLACWIICEGACQGQGYCKNQGCD